MANFLLIHGAWHGAWCWYKVIPELEALGYRAAAIDLPSHGRDTTSVADVTLDSYAESVAIALRDLPEPVHLIGHSMGSIIAYDSLWQLSQEPDYEQKIDLLMTMGSPLAQKFIQRRIKGAKGAQNNRYPRTIRRWVNIAAVGDLTSIDMKMENDYEDMEKLGLLESIVDKQVFNYFRLDGELNVHAEYGYLINEVTSGFVSEWWRAVTPDRGSA